MEHFESTTETHAYPDPHTIWDQIAIPPSISTLRAMVDFFQQTHGLTVDSWSIKTAGIDTLTPVASIKNVQTLDYYHDLPEYILNYCFLATSIDSM